MGSKHWNLGPGFFISGLALGAQYQLHRETVTSALSNLDFAGTLELSPSILTIAGRQKENTWEFLACLAAWCIDPSSSSPKNLSRTADTRRLEELSPQLSDSWFRAVFDRDD
jgi:hypothetical protein